MPSSFDPRLVYSKGPAIYTEHRTAKEVGNEWDTMCTKMHRNRAPNMSRHCWEALDGQRAKREGRCCRHGEAGHESAGESLGFQLVIVLVRCKYIVGQSRSTLPSLSSSPNPSLITRLRQRSKLAPNAKPYTLHPCLRRRQKVDESIPTTLTRWLLRLATDDLEIRNGQAPVDLLRESPRDLLRESPRELTDDLSHARFPPCTRASPLSGPNPLPPKPVDRSCSHRRCRRLPKLSASSPRGRAAPVRSATPRRCTARAGGE
jgi:hypothetical protein